MVNQKLLDRDIETLLESIRYAWLELSKATDIEKRYEIKKQLRCLFEELKILIDS